MGGGGGSPGAELRSEMTYQGCTVRGSKQLGVHMAGNQEGEPGSIAGA